MKKICFTLFLFLQLTVALSAQFVSENDRQYIQERWDKADALEKSGKLAEAEKELKDLASRYPDNAGIWTFLGEILKKRLKTDEAIAACKRALSINPNWLQANRVLGLTYLQQTKDFESAVLFLKKEYELHIADFKRRNLPVGNDFYTSNLAEALFGAKKFEEAGVEFEKFVILAPDKDFYKMRLAVCYLELKRLPDAENIIKPLVDSFPDSYRVWKIYADVLKAQNRTPEADDAYQKYRSLCPKCAVE
jgi:predicted Zn-dependent protease